MRALLLLVGLAFLTDASAQTAPFDSARALPVNAGSGLVMLEVIEPDAPAATPALADALLRALGRPWLEVARGLVPPDTSTVQDGLGDVVWSVPGYPVDGFSAFVQRGIVESVRLDFTDAGPDLSGFADRLYARHGSPRPDGFYATDQTGYPFSLVVDRRTNRLDARAVPGQLVGDDVPLPVQFATVHFAAEDAAEVPGSGDANSPAAPPNGGEGLVQGPYSVSDSVHTYAESPPEIMGGLAAVQRAVVYPEEGQGDGIVYVQLVVEPDGSSSGARVARSTESAFEGAALEAVSRLRFRPGRHRGEVVRAQLVVPVRFLPPPEPVPDTAPTEVDMAYVEYPVMARRAGVQGTLVFDVAVRKDGTVGDVTLDLESSRFYCPLPKSSACRAGREELVEAAEKAIRTSTFAPATRNGQPISARHSVPITFTLR